MGKAKCEYEHCALSHDLKQQKRRKLGSMLAVLDPGLDKNRKGYGGGASQSISGPLMLRTESRI